MAFELALLSLFIGFVGTLIGILVTTGIARKQLQQNNDHLGRQIAHSIELAEKQEKQTEKITIMTSDLEDKVNRLSLRLSQRLEILRRLRDVVLELIEANLMMTENRSQKIKGTGEAPVFPSSNLMIQTLKNDVEMRAIGIVIKDATLDSIVTKEFDVYRKQNRVFKTANESDEYGDTVNKYYLRILTRIYELIEETTKDAKQA